MTILLLSTVAVICLLCARVCRQMTALTQQIIIDGAPLPAPHDVTAAEIICTGHTADVEYMAVLA